LVPAIADLHAPSEQDGPEEPGFQDVRPHAPEIEEAVAARLGVQEARNQQTNQHKRQRRGEGGAEGE
jgi:hypothetical protein